MSEDTKLSIEPIGDRIVVEVIEQPEAHERNGVKIIIPDQARNTPQIGKVVAVGPGIPYRGPGRVVRTSEAATETEVHEAQPLPVAVGDYVVYGKFSGVEVQIPPDTIFVLRADEVLAKLHGYVEVGKRESELSAVS